MRTCLVYILFSPLIFAASAQTTLAPGRQPQITVDSKSVVRIVYGEKNKIYYTASDDAGLTFSTPVLVGEVNEMHLGMTRGPQLATSKHYSIITAMDKTGNIHSFRQTHKNGQWKKLGRVNDEEASAPEGLMSIAADQQDNFYAVWLDLREGRKNNIWYSTLQNNGNWAANKFAYRSPESHVCECCKPSIAVRNEHVAILFRNWLGGARDIYLVHSTDRGRTFSKAMKLGNGTWPLKGCPMDGGGLAIDTDNVIHTAWQREGNVFYSRPGKAEEKISSGRSVGMNGTYVHWQEGSSLMVQKMNGDRQEVGEGTALQVHEFNDQSILTVWEKDGQIIFRKL